MSERSDRGDELTLLELGSIVFASWTVGYLVALAVGFGFALALPLAMLTLFVALFIVRKSSTSLPKLRGPRLGSSAAWATLLGVGCFSAFDPAIRGVGLPLVFACIALAVWFDPMRSSANRLGSRPNAPNRRSSVALAMFGAACLAVLHSASFNGFVLAICVVSLVSVVLTFRQIQNPLPGPAHPPFDRGLRWGSELPIWGLGALLGAWTLFTQQFNADDTYYINKAAHYGLNPGSYEIANYQFGMLDEPHLPKADVLSAYEPLIGVVSAITQLHHASLAYLVFAPLAAFAIAPATRYMARAFDADRPDFVAAVTVAGLLFLERFGDFILLEDKIFQGKGVLVLAAMPMLFGALARAWNQPRAGRITVASAATIACLGLTPTAAAPGLGAVLALTVAGGVLAFRRGRLRHSLAASIPLAIMAAFTVFAFWFHESGGQVREEFRRFDNAENAWSRRLLSDTTDGAIEFEFVPLLVMGCAVFVLLGHRSPHLRLFLAFICLGLFGILFNPALFDPLVSDALHLNFLAWRFGWILPTAALLGLAADSLGSSDLLSDSQDHWRAAAVHQSGLIVVGAILLIGSPLYARSLQTYPAPWDVRPAFARIANQIENHTEPGERYLGYTAVEHGASIVSPEIYPTYVRADFLQFHHEAGASEAFQVELRRELSEIVEGKPATMDPIETLDAVDISTVCIHPDNAGSDLHLALPEKFEIVWNNRRCELWGRTVPASG